jgi:hypothetical protein
MGKYKYKLKENGFNVGDKDVKNDIESTITDIDPSTGGVSWDIKKLPSIETVFNKLKDLSEYVNTLDIDTEDDFIDDLNSKIKNLFHSYRTHIRNRYPEAYNKLKGVNEISTSGGAGGYLSKYSFSKKKITESEPGAEDFQQKRIAAFDELDGRLIDIKKKLKIAQLATNRHYRENPDTWGIVYGTDLISEYFNDIEKLLEPTEE